MANPGSRKSAFGRAYVAVNPDIATGPSTWNLAIPDEISLPIGGGGGVIYDFKGNAPVNVTVGTGTTPQVVTTSLDFIQLNSRTA